jgi:hypothetical protein
MGMDAAHTCCAGMPCSYVVLYAVVAVALFRKQGTCHTRFQQHFGGGPALLRHMRATVSTPVDVTCTAQVLLLMIVADMHDLPLITTIAVAFTAAWILGLLTQRLGLSPIVGYLLAGILIGPHTPGFVGDADIARQLAEVGVILLMFGVGLHFHLKDLLAVKGIAVHYLREREDLENAGATAAVFEEAEVAVRWPDLSCRTPVRVAMKWRKESVTLLVASKTNTLMSRPFH